MDRGKILAFLFSLLLGVAGWALSRMVEGLAWLPYLALPLSLAGMLVILAQGLFDWKRRARRQSLPGFSVHMVVRVSDIREPRRRYFFDWTEKGKPGGSFYVSASDRFIFTVTDARGEPYSLEVPAGHHGFPIAHIFYVSLEAGTDGQRTQMRASRNGEVLGERTLPFAVNFGSIDFKGSLGADRDGGNTGGFDLLEFVALERTLDHAEAAQMATYYRDKFNLEG